MKTFIFATLIALTSVSVMAHTASDLENYHSTRYVVKQSSWQEGIPNKGIKTPYGIIYTKLYNVCQENGNLKTINPVKMCAERGPKPERCDNGSRNCFDRDEKVCVRYEYVNGSSPIRGTRKTCADYFEARRMGWSGDRRDFESDYPNCSAFKTYNTTTKTQYNFTVGKKSITASDREERLYGGLLVDEFTYTIPACN